jgi:serine phosphatase RsbU (regulator of sigma subunit)
MGGAAESLAYEPWIAIAQASGPAGCGDCVRMRWRQDGRALFFIADVAGHDARAARAAREVDALIPLQVRDRSPRAGSFHPS